MKTFKNTKLMTFGLTVALLLSGCAKENTENFGPDKGSQDVLFSINIPDKSKSATRAMSDNDESRVKSIEVLLFKNGKVASNPAFTSNITADPDGDINKKSFSVSLPEGTFDIMIFANSLAAFKNASIALDDDQEATLAKLKASMPATGWVADGSDASLIPMWGMREGQAITAGTKISNMYLHRMLSRIDVSVTGADLNTGDFKLLNIKLYNVQKQGRIAPVMANWDKDGKVNAGLPNEQLAGKVTAPSLSGDGIHASPISYKSVIAADKKSCTREMYLFEAAKATADADLLAPYLTVLGEYNGVEGWYRIDLANYSNMNYLHVLRNHLYKIQIDQVSGTGYAEEEDAKKNRATNIVVNVTLWNDYDMGGTVFDGAHFVSITPQDVEYGKEAQVSQKIVIKTDIGTTLTAASIKLSDSDRDPDAGFATAWIKNVSLGAPTTVENRKVYELTYDVEANNAQPRAAYIYVTASSRLTNVVRISQTDEAKNMLIITDGNDVPITEMIFAAAADVMPVEQSFRVDWAPTVANLIVNTTTIGMDAFPTGVAFTPSLGNILDGNGGTGTITYKISPPALTTAEITANPFMEKVSKVDFATTNGIIYKSESIFMRQINYNLLTDIAVDYLLDSKPKTIKVRANFPWTITGVSDTDDILQSENSLIGETGGNNTTTGDDLSFTMSAPTSDGSKNGKTATITITNLIDKKTWTITITAAEDLYVGYFGGELKADVNGVWQFERKLYVQKEDAGIGIKWGPTSLVPGGGASSTWNGKGNTFALRTDTYPAGNLCFTKNANHAAINSVTHADYVWYLPAQNQLMAAWGAHNSFGSNDFGSANYWSATENAATYSWTVSFFNGNTYYSTKTSPYPVRCVREL